MSCARSSSVVPARLPPRRCRDVRPVLVSCRTHLWGRYRPVRRSGHCSLVPIGDTAARLITEMNDARAAVALLQGLGKMDALAHLRLLPVFVQHESPGVIWRRSPNFAYIVGSLASTSALSLRVPILEIAADSGPTSFVAVGAIRSLGEDGVERLAFAHRNRASCRSHRSGLHMSASAPQGFGSDCRACPMSMTSADRGQYASLLGCLATHRMPLSLGRCPNGSPPWRRAIGGA